MYQPGISFTGAQQTQALGQQLAQIPGDLLNAYERYRKDQSQNALNDTLFQHLATKTDSQGNPLIDPKDIERYASSSPDKRSGIVMGAAANVKADIEQQAAQNQTLATQASAAYHQSLADQSGFTPTQDDIAAAQQAGYQLVPTGHGRFRPMPYGGNSTFNPTQDQITQGNAAGRVWLPTSPNSGMWAEDPNNPANLGTKQPTPIPDPRDPSGRTVVGMQDAKGNIRMFRAPTSSEAFANMFSSGNSSAQQQTPTPTPTPAAPVQVQTVQDAIQLPPGTRFVNPNGQVMVR